MSISKEMINKLFTIHEMKHHSDNNVTEQNITEKIFNVF